jgi:predicted nuclease of predicted toxin-antitoxin system
LKIKLDENLGKRCAALFEAAGHDTATVVTQNLCGASDAEVIARCRDESRAIVTLDLDFGNPLLFKPSEYHGIAVLRPRSPVSINELQELCLTLIGGLARESLDRRLWIVELGRIRIHQEGTLE